MNIRKRIVLFIFAVACLLSCGCGAPAASPAVSSESVEFTDDCGRTVYVPEKIESVAVSGPLAQIYLIPLCSDLFVGVSTDYSTNMLKYLPEELASIPMLGQLYGGKGTMDLEQLLAAAPDVVIDVGEQKGSMADDLSELSERSGIPFIHIEATVETAPAAYRKLGMLLGRQEKAEQLAVWCENTLGEIEAIMARVDEDDARKSLIYCLGDKGLNVLADGSYHAETIAFIAENAAKCSDVSSSGLGNEIDFEQLMLWNPEYIVFAPGSAYSECMADPSWQQLDALKSGNCFETPAGPYGWLQSPPSIQRYLAMLWIPSLLYPEYCTYDLQEEVTEYYRLFYGYELSEEDYASLTIRALK